MLHDNPGVYYYLCSFKLALLTVNGLVSVILCIALAAWTILCNTMCTVFITLLSIVEIIWFCCNVVVFAVLGA